ncbi:MAG: hypothetical protein Q9217_006644 [Psora testacea]
MTFLSLPIILTSWLSSTIFHSHALPAPQVSPLETSSSSLPSDPALLNTTNPNSDYFVCYDAPIMRQSQRAPTLDCLKAVLRLSRRADTALFHQDGVDDGFRLPVEKTYASCSVTVEIAQGHTEDKSSWVGISLLASQLTQACSTLNFPSGKTGGETFEGNAGKVRISVGRPRTSNDATNGTDVHTDGGDAASMTTGRVSTLLTAGTTGSGQSTSDR